jgi:putative Mg2+ transporter-C (MgtC) family protein
MPLITQLESGGLILLALLLSAIIGLNRERSDHPAGLRTHILVGVGSCVFTLLSIFAFGNGDPGRVASQILPGLGFLGAGAILKQENTIVGITTAASLWATAAIGMSVGTGAWLLAILLTLSIWITLVVIRYFEVRVLATKKEG